ncbi:MAG: hypothetical protein FJ303_08205 [Planctomycetes bacterium]|nr:hypothetical protein [Planctomycetota bacterium]
MWRASRTMALAIVAGFLFPPTLPAQTPKPLAAGLRADWEKAGFEVGWMAPDEGGAGIPFRTRNDGPKPGDLLAFRSRLWHSGALEKLRMPDQPFALSLRSSVSDAGLKELAGLENLTALDLVLSEATDSALRDLASIPNLTSLDLRMVPSIMDAGLKHLARCGNLRTLYVDATNASATEIDDLNAAGALPVLALRSRVTVEGLKELASLKALASLHLLLLQVKDADYQSVASLPRLHSLSLCGCKMAAGVGFKQLAACKELRTINVTFAMPNAVGLRQLAGIESLRTLNFYYTPVTDAELTAITEIEQLHTLRLSGTAVTGKGAKELGRLKNLKALYLDRTKWTDAGMKEIAWLRQLQTLDLGRTAISTRGLNELVRLKNLRHINVRGTAVNDAGVLQQALPSLRIDR